MTQGLHQDDTRSHYGYIARRFIKECFPNETVPWHDFQDHQTQWTFAWGVRKERLPGGNSRASDTATVTDARGRRLGIISTSVELRNMVNDTTIWNHLGHSCYWKLCLFLLRNDFFTWNFFFYFKPFSASGVYVQSTRITNPPDLHYSKPTQ